MKFDRYDSEFSDDFLKFDFKINEKQFKATLNKYLIAKRESDGTLSENEIEYLLESCAAWREVFWVAYVEVKDLGNKKQDDIDIKMSDWEFKAKEDIWDNRVTLTGKQIAPSNMNITKEEIKNWILREHRKEYTKLTNELQEYQKLERLLYGTYQNLVSRGMELQSLLKGKRPNQFQGEIIAREM